MQAIILAAGMGKRLKKLTQNNTKCMVKVNGVTLAERLLRQLDARNLSRIVLVVGYQRQALIDYIATLDIHTPVEFIENPIYDTTNNFYSLSLAKEQLCEEIRSFSSLISFSRIPFSICCSTIREKRSRWSISLSRGWTARA